jgi:hypothetical protein
MARKGRGSEDQNLPGYIARSRYFSQRDSNKRLHETVGERLNRITHVAIARSTSPGSDMVASAIGVRTHPGDTALIRPAGAI